MRRNEDKFTAEEARRKALKWGKLIQGTRLQRNLTQSAAAERARMSPFTWLKIEKGDASVSMGAWLSAMDVLGLLDGLSLPELSALPPQPRLRARQSTTSDQHYDF